MAEKKKKKSIYSRKLKDVNKDGKKNFGDTWLGDMIGADGKAGIQKGRPGLKASLKGARREDGKADTTAQKAKETGETTLKKITAGDEKPTTPLQRGPKTRKGPRRKDKDEAPLKTGPSTRQGPRRKDKASLKSGPSTRQGPRGQAGLKYKGVTYSEYLDIVGNNALKKALYGLPANLSRTEFMRRAKAAQKKKEAEARKDKTDEARVERSRYRGYKAGGVVRSNCGASMKPNRKSRK